MFAQLENNQDGSEDSQTVVFSAQQKSRNSINIKNINGKAVDIHQEASQRLEELESDFENSKQHIQSKLEEAKEEVHVDDDDLPDVELSIKTKSLSYDVGREYLDIFCRFLNDERDVHQDCIKNFCSLVRAFSSECKLPFLDYIII